VFLKFLKTFKALKVKKFAVTGLDKMVPFKMRGMLFFLLCFQVSRGYQSLSRVVERLDELEEELVTERRHRREDVKALNHQLESLRQTCGCDKSKPVTPGQELSKSKNAKETSLANVEPSSMARLRLAFKQEKEVNERLRSGLVQAFGRLEGELTQTMLNVTKTILDAKQDLVDKQIDLVHNVTRFIDDSNKTIGALVLDSTHAMDNLKYQLVDEMNTFKLDITTDIAATKHMMKDIYSAAVNNMTLLVKNTEQSLSKNVSTVKLELENIKKQIIHTTSNLSVSMDAGLYKVSNSTAIDVCPRSESPSGLYSLSSTSPILDKTPVYCDTQTDGGGWIVFQRRQDGSVDFYRGWEEYKKGFGSPSSEFWWGLERLHETTHNKPRELRIDLEDFSGNKAYAHYTSFSIASESDKYAITVSGYSGTAGDSLDGYHNGRPFTTKDRDNNSWSNVNCAVKYIGAWWFRNCLYSHLNGKYRPAGELSHLYGEGPVWLGFNNYRALKFTEMKIR